MSQFEHSILVDRPPLDVFEFVTNLDNYDRWQSGRETFQWVTEGPPGVGSRYQVTATVLGREIEYDFEITDWDVPNQYAISGSRGPFSSVYARKFEAQVGGTLFTQRSQVEVSGMLGIIEALVGKFTEREFSKVFPNLKLVLEAEQKNKS